MKTSSFFLYQGPGRISIARFAPKDIPPGYIGKLRSDEIWVCVYTKKTL